MREKFIVWGLVACVVIVVYLIVFVHPKQELYVQHTFLMYREDSLAVVTDVRINNETVYKDTCDVSGHIKFLKGIK